MFQITVAKKKKKKLKISRREKITKNRQEISEVENQAKK